MNESNMWILGSQLAFAAPFIVACFVGLIVALFFIRKYTAPSVLTSIAMCIFLFVSVGLPVAQSYLLRARVESGWTNLQYSRALMVVEGFGGLSRTLAIVLLLIAVFVKRRTA